MIVACWSNSSELPMSETYRGEMLFNGKLQCAIKNQAS